MAQKTSIRLMFLAFVVFALAALSLQAFAGAADPGQPVDARICGRDGNTTQAQTIRWTDVFSVADPDATTGNAYPPSTAVTILGRDYWGCWVKVDSATYDGWVPVDALNTNTVMSLPVLFDNSGGKCVKDGVICGQVAPTPRPTTPSEPVDSRICGRDGNARNANTIRWTNIYNGPSASTVTNRAYAPNTNLDLEGRDYWGCWVKVVGSNWVPVDSLNTRGVMGLPVLVDNR